MNRVSTTTNVAARVERASISVAEVLGASKTHGRGVTTLDVMSVLLKRDHGLDVASRTAADILLEYGVSCSSLAGSRARNHRRIAAESDGGSDYSAELLRAIRYARHSAVGGEMRPVHLMYGLLASDCLVTRLLGRAVTLRRFRKELLTAGIALRNMSGGTASVVEPAGDLERSAWSELSRR